MIVSSTDKTAYLYRNGVEIGRAGVANPQLVLPLNDRVFTALNGLDAEGHLRWVEGHQRERKAQTRASFRQRRRVAFRVSFWGRPEESSRQGRQSSLPTSR